MKQIVFVLSFLVVGAFSAQAQCNKSASASKACCASKKTASATTESNTSMAAATAEVDAVLAQNEDIMKRTCEVSGTTTYYQKSVSTDGVVSWEEVAYDASTKSFTKVASASMEKDPATGEKVKTEAKACCSKSKGAKACAGKDMKEGCSKKEGTK